MYEKLAFSNKERENSKLGLDKKNDESNNLSGALSLVLSEALGQEKHSKNSNLFHSAFKHDEIMQFFVGDMAKNYKNIKDNFRDKTYKLADNVAKTIIDNNKSRMEAIKNFLNRGL